jgi:transcriptional regulator with GAF, ATPase, and Fis domain
MTSDPRNQIADLERQISHLEKQLEQEQIRQRRYDELLKFERLLSELSSRFINLPLTDMQSEVEKGLKAIAHFLDVDQIAIVEFSKDRSQLVTKYSYSRENIESPVPVLPSEDFTYWTEQVTKGNLVIWPTIEDIPESAAAERQYVLNDGIKSHLSIPLKIGNVIIGVVGCHSFSKHRKWSDALLARFRLIGEMIGNTLGRQMAEKKLQTAFTEITVLKEQLEAENIYLREEINLQHQHKEILGKSQAIKKVLSQIEQVAGTDATVLVSGETGTGKELIARAIHNLSSRKKRPMVILNCAALPSSLVESELFGREKGAYTGAMTRQSGRFELADNSTIFLDEINALPPEVQAKLLRVLQYGTFERLGSTDTLKVNVRVIAATNKDLNKAVNNGDFREDLFYRLNVFPIEVPPLRERGGDIPLLVWAFVREFSESMGKTIDTIPKKSMQALEAYSWPGNVREVKNFIERAMIVTNGSTLQLPPLESSDAVYGKAKTLDDLQRQHIYKVLDKTGWRISGPHGAARILGINPKTLASRMKKLDIQKR